MKLDVIPRGAMPISTFDKNTLQSASGFGTWGDFVGGIAGPLLSFVSFSLVFISFRESTKSSKVVRFEGVFYNETNTFQKERQSLQDEFMKTRK